MSRLPPTRAARGPALRPGPLERAAAWLHTGPLGHLWSVLADIVVLWGRFGVARVRRARAGR